MKLSNFLSKLINHWDDLRNCVCLRSNYLFNPRFFQVKAPVSVIFQPFSTIYKDIVIKRRQSFSRIFHNLPRKTDFKRRQSFFKVFSQFTKINRYQTQTITFKDFSQFTKKNRYQTQTITFKVFSQFTKKNRF